jgi:hypothetical protein
VKVNAWKTIDVEVEVDVQLEDVLNEIGSIADEEGMPKRKLAAIDQATRIVEKLGVEPLRTLRAGSVRLGAAVLLRGRLAAFLAWCDEVERKGGA